MIKVSDANLGKGFKWFLVVWTIGALSSVALTGAIIYVVWHFISKFW